MSSVRRNLGRWPVALVMLTCGVSLFAADVTFFDDGEFSLRAADAGVLEAAVPIYHNGVPVPGGNHKVIEAFDRVPGTGSFPLTFVDLHANGYLRATYQRADGTTASLGTSVVGAPSFRTNAGLQFIPQVSRGDVFTGGADRYRGRLSGEYGADAIYQSQRRFEDPILGRTAVDLDISLIAGRDIALTTHSFFTGNDRLRVLTVSSMFAFENVFDADLIRFEDAEGFVRTIELFDDTPRDAYLMPQPVEVGGWMELVKRDGSTWFADSPTMRIVVDDAHGLRLGVQGYLAGTRNPNDDSLSVWLEWLDAPDTIPLSTRLDVGVTMIAYRWPMRGDMNDDATVDAFDVDAFELALADAGAYALAYPGVDPLARGDLDGSGGLDSFDVAPFEALLAGGGVPTPSPGSLAPLVLMGSICRRRWRRRIA